MFALIKPFIPLLTSFFKNNWKSILSVVSILLLTTIIYFKNNSIKDLKDKNEVLGLRITNLESQLKQCTLNIDLQNSKIEKAKIEADAKFKDYQNNTDKVIREISNNYNKTIRDLRNKPVPTTCEEVRIYLRNNIENFK